MLGMSDSHDDTLDEEVPEMPEDFGKEWTDDPLHINADDIPADVDEDTE